MSESEYINAGKAIDKYLGFENDITFVYKPNSYTSVQFGYSYMLASESMPIIKSTQKSDMWHDWAYIMVTFRPNILKLKV